MHWVKLHPLYVRIFHWLNAFAIVVMVMSGWQIYNASPLFESLVFPHAITLGGWLGGAIQFHLAAMWLFVVNLLIYLILGLATVRFRMRFLPLYPRDVVHDLGAAMTFRLKHDSHDYNAVQKLFYVGVIGAMLMTFLSGLVVWKPVQMQALSYIFGNYATARYVHFAGMSLICAFIIVHLSLVLLVPSTLLPMITGRAKAFPNEEKNNVA